MQVIQWNGKPIGEPGIYAGVPLTRYHSADICDGPSVPSSGLRLIFSKSAAHYWAQSPYNPERLEVDETAKRHFIVGRAAHHLFLGQREFHKEFVIRPETLLGEKWNGNRTLCKKWLAEHEGKGLSVLKPDEGQTILRMAKALAREPLVKSGILHGKLEHSIFWRGPGGTWLKARPDAIPNDSDDVSDYKTTVSVDPVALAWTIDDFSYHMQGGMIGMGWEAVFGRPMNSFNLIFQEKTEPHCVYPVALKDGDLKRGTDECLTALATFQKCMKASAADLAIAGEDTLEAKAARDRLPTYWPGPAGRKSELHYVGLNQRAEDDRNYRLAQLKRENDS